MTLYTDRKPREAVARAINPGAWSHLWAASAADQEAGRERSLVTAASVLNTLRELGFITSEGLDAIHAEEDANGEPRSSVVPGERK